MTIPVRQAARWYGPLAFRCLRVYSGLRDRTTEGDSMDALLSTEDAATLAAARTVLDTLQHTAGVAALRELGKPKAEPHAADLARVSEAARNAQNAITNALIVAKVHGESAEAGAVL